MLPGEGLVVVDDAQVMYEDAAGVEAVDDLVSQWGLLLVGRLQDEPRASQHSR